MTFALVSLHQAFDLFVVVGIVSLGAFSWSRMRRKDAQRRIEQKEKQAEYTRRHLRWDRERDEALRCNGSGVRS